MNRPWFNVLPAEGCGSVRLYCLPHAGTSHSVFQHWHQLYDENVELALVKYPGRGARYLDPVHDSLQSLVNDLAKAIALESNKPFALFGHSMGSLIAFELAHQLRRAHNLSPSALFVSGGTSPSTRQSKTMIHKLSESDFSKKILAMNGIPKEVSSSPELMSIFLPILRHDFTLCERHIYKKSPPLDCPITVFGGLDDPNTNKNQLLSWQQETTSTFSLTWLKGDHFFLFQHEQFIADIIRKGLRRAVVTPDLCALTS